MGYAALAIKLAKAVTMGMPKFARHYAKEILGMVGPMDEEYLASGGYECPKCGSPVSSDGADVDGNAGTGNVWCTNCDFEGVDFWELVGIEEAQELPGESE